MLEYCYAANALAFYYLFAAPHSATLRRVRAVLHRGHYLLAFMPVQHIA